MEWLAETSETAIPLIDEPSRAAFLPLLEKNRPYIEEIPRRTFKYGETDRHQLDVYYPIKSSKAKAPVLFFIYGGGFVFGHRIYPAPYQIGYQNLGAYFAHRGFLTIIPDYRLVPDVTFPGPVEDLRDAFLWLLLDYTNIGIPGSPAPDVHDIYIQAHSAGATHISTLLFHPDVVSPETRSTLIPRIQKIVLNAGAYHFDSVPAADPTALAQYYGAPADIKAKQPLTLLENASDEVISSLPEIMLIRGEKEPPYVGVIPEDFRRVLEARLEKVGGGRGGWKTARKAVNKGHNHISCNWALSSGEGEEWTEPVVEFFGGVRS